MLFNSLRVSYLFLQYSCLINSLLCGGIACSRNMVAQFVLGRNIHRFLCHCFLYDLIRVDIRFVQECCNTHKNIIYI